MSKWSSPDTPPTDQRTVLVFTGVGGLGTAFYAWKKWAWSYGHAMTVPPLKWRDLTDILKEVEEDD